MNQTNRIMIIGLCLILLLIIFELIRRKKLKEKYALLWLVAGISILLLAVFQGLLDWITKLFGMVLPSNAVLLFGIFFIILINLHLCLVLSNYGEQIKRIAQAQALIESRVQGLENRGK
ncbi:MAG: DUF2304 domain-containing protein [Candidatus Omnitrophica bacterium]|nr:DUF2304 domain-containing protein [Candidatus Omnitrophota bacterium]